MVRQTLVAVMLLFPLSEVALAVMRRSRRRRAASEDRGSLRLLWLAIVLGIILANVALRFRAAQVPVSRSVVETTALALMVFGLAVRWVAILTLGRFFTVDVAIHADHAVVQTGLYRFVRHPSYTGLMLAFLGLGVFSGNWLSLVGLLLPIALAVANRVAKEEQALLSSLGPEYAAYCARTRRFLPGLF